MKWLATKLGIFLLEVLGVAIKSAAAAATIILVARYFKVFWL